MARNNFIDRVPNYPGRFEMIKSDGTIEIVTLVRADEASIEGTKLNAQSLNLLAQFEDFSPADFLVNTETKEITLKNSGGGASEIDVYRNTAMIWRLNNQLDAIVIVFYNTTNDIDVDFFDGAAIVSDYFDTKENYINKTSTETLSYCTPGFNYNAKISKVGASVDGVGDITISISLDDGLTWTDLTSEITSLASPSSAGKARLKITMTGECVIKNMMWGWQYIE